jgi:hypothetical protein
MTYVGDLFGHDIFITYSHGDDGNGRALLQSWSAEFTQALELELRLDRRLRPLRIFIDKDHRPDHGVDPMKPLTDQLKSQIERSALLVVLMSPDYLASDWCKQEREWWANRQLALEMPSAGRIAVVRILPTDSAWPSPLTDSAGQPLVGFPFHASSDGLARPLGWTDSPHSSSPKFKQALIGIVSRLVCALDDTKKRLQEIQQSRAEAEKLQAEGGQAVYLHGRVAQASVWKRAATTLDARSFAVLPGEPEQVARDHAKRQQASERRIEKMSACDALLLLGTDDGDALDADLVVVGKHDRQSARARSNRLLPCALLDTVGAPVATSVRKSTARNLQIDWLDCTQADWGPLVRQWLAKRGAQS